MANDTQLTPMMAQYRRIKAELPKDSLLLFRLGDFYELFFEDAQTGAQLLNIALTRRNGVPMCGLPYHAAPSYISRLLKAGRKVAICDQTEEAKPGKLVNREVTQILSPGTHFDERMLAAERNNYLAAIYHESKAFGFAAVDLTTGQFRCTEVQHDRALMAELERLRPSEIICPAERIDAFKSLCANVSGYDDWTFAADTAVFTLREHFKVASLDGFGLKGHVAAIGAAGAIVHYLAQHLRRDIAHLTSISFYEPGDFMHLDATSLRHLEILEPLHADSSRSCCLYGALNRTATPMGARRLRDWLTQPLADVTAIAMRQEVVERFVRMPELLDAIRKQLAEVRDLERTLGRLSVGSGNARDLFVLRMGLEQIPAIKRSVRDVQDGEVLADTIAEEFPSIALAPVIPKPGTSGLLAALQDQLTELPSVVDLIRRGVIDDPPLTVKEGGMIRDGFDPNLDEVRRANREGKDWIAQLQLKEIERTGIASLKIRFNSVFGYYIEVTKSHLGKVPNDYIRKQTVANAERFITPELKEVEGRVLGAEDRSVKLEYELFQKIREEALGSLKLIQDIANALAQVDVLAAFAETARLFNYCRPEVSDEGRIEIVDGRHPVLDQALIEERFVPNDARLDGEIQVALITGPNMAGKSTFIRQVALLALMAHTGSFVPAVKARIDLVDRIFTRIGASDDLARGQSTFMVEMSETANILNNATRRSLVILDEIGRGTSTFDGLSLAWSIVEYLHNQVGAKTLFATHYHELTELAGRLPRVRNFHVAVREWNDQVVFLRKIVEGGTDKSYGIQVARLAGVPRVVLDRAKIILRNLEASELTPEGTVRNPSRHHRDREKLRGLEPPPQLDLFS